MQCNRVTSRAANPLFRLFVAGAVAALSMAAAPAASADVPVTSTRRDAPAARNDVAEAPDAPNAPRRAPPPNEGFQLAIGSGYSIPFGNVDDSLSQSNFVSGQVPLLMDIGYKLSPHVYMGAYVGLGFGQAGDRLANLCDDSGVDCSSSTLRVGFNLQYHMNPGDRWNPYIGYGIGYEFTSFEASGPGGNAAVSVSGFELARLGVGVDYRASSAIGFGPYADLGLGIYSNISDGGPSMPLASASMHGWLGLGVRATLFP